MEENSKIAYTEVYTILNLLEDDAVSKIPKKVMDFFYEERDLKYKTKIDLSKPLEEQGLQKKTIVLLAILNLNYWCDSEEEKNEFLAELERNGQYEKQALEEKYNPDNIFKKKKEKKKTSEDDETLQLVEYKDKNFIQKFLEKIRKFFRKD